MKLLMESNPNNVALASAGGERLAVLASCSIAPHLINSRTVSINNFVGGFLLILLALALVAAGPDPDEVDGKGSNPTICKLISRTGSRIASRKVCKPESEWQVLTASTRRDLADIQRRAAPESIPSF